MMFLRHKGFIAFVVVALVLLGTFITHITTNKGAQAAEWVKGLKSKPPGSCPDSLDWVSTLEIAWPVKYARRDIIVKPRDGLGRESVSRIEETLFPEFEELDLSQDTFPKLRNCKDPLRIDVPAFSREPPDASHIIFGISTTLDRLENSIPSLVRWLPHSRARLYVIVIEYEQHDDVKAKAADPAKKAELQQKMRDMGMDVTLEEPLRLEDSFSEKYFSLIKIMYSHRNDQTQWISTIDDDTFFTSIPALVEMLAKYDYNEKHYVGGLSENWWSVTRYGLMAFGGAGVFLSRAMGEIIDANYELCKKRSDTSAGDIRILECVYALTTSKLSNERDLHQIDVWSDLSGIFESGRLPISFHHWKPGAANEEGYDMPLMHTVADVCRECFLQRWWFNEDALLTNGYSIAFYPKGDLEKANLNFMENTWGEVTPVEFSVNHGVDHSLGPTRPKLELDKQKIQYKLIASSAIDGGVRQAYLHKGNGGMDSLLELFWLEEGHESVPRASS